MPFHDLLAVTRVTFCRGCERGQDRAFLDVGEKRRRRVFEFVDDQCGLHLISRCPRVRGD